MKPQTNHPTFESIIGPVEIMPGHLAAARITTRLTFNVAPEELPEDFDFAAIVLHTGEPDTNARATQINAEQDPDIWHIALPREPRGDFMAQVKNVEAYYDLLGASVVALLTDQEGVA